MDCQELSLLNFFYAYDNNVIQGEFRSTGRRRSGLWDGSTLKEAFPEWSGCIQ